jgi:hypothetical protein
MCYTEVEMRKVYYEILGGHSVREIPLNALQFVDYDEALWPRVVAERNVKSTFALDLEAAEGESLAVAITPRSPSWEVISANRFAVLRRRVKPYRLVWLKPVLDDDNRIVGVTGYNPLPADVIMVALILSDDIVGGPKALRPIFLDRGLSAVWNDIHDGQGHGRHPSWYYRCRACKKITDLPESAIPSHFYKKLNPDGH